MKIKIGALAVAICLLFVGGWKVSAQRKESAKITPWEYKVEIGLSEANLNAFGAAGWDLVSVTPAIPSEYNSGSERYYLKRAK